MTIHTYIRSSITIALCMYLHVVEQMIPGLADDTHQPVAVPAKCLPQGRRAGGGGGGGGGVARARVSIFVTKNFTLKCNMLLYMYVCFILVRSINGNHWVFRMDWKGLPVIASSAGSFRPVNMSFYFSHLTVSVLL